MSEEELIETLKEFEKSRVDKLKEPSRNLFYAIMKIADERDKYKEILDKIKEYITTRKPSDIGISGNKPKKYYTLSEDEVDYILELLEEIE